jgi:Type ISP C-terminal specificity domain/N-6 DNA Methylase
VNLENNLLREEPPGYSGSPKPSPVALYLRQVETAHKKGNDTEHTHRPALKALLEILNPQIVATNEPKRITCGAPDLVINRKKTGLLVGHLEAKDIGTSLNETKKADQLKRYLSALANLLLTDYIEFHWYVDGTERAKFRLGQVKSNGEIIPDPAAIKYAEKVLTEFLERDPVRIEGAEELARRLARLTHLIRDSIAAAFQSGNASEVLTDWREVFAQTLLPELADEGKETEFADMFAQTLAYGLFSARVMSGSARQFTLTEAAKLIPRTNPFLRDFFDLIAGPKLEDEPFIGFVQDIVTMLECADMGTILEDFGKGVKNGRRRDPVVHFYETFLSAYDPRLRELRGVYYTPEPVVSYIVESIDWLLREKFALKDGLADKTKFSFTRKDGKREAEEESHRVLVLDPATGTGTFLFEVIEQIRERFEKKHQAGLWPAYVHEHLLPRLFGFELLMAPYAVAHFKIGLELSGRHLPELWRGTWAYHFQPDERVNIYLTNTLEGIEHVTHQAGPLAALTKEANEASSVKRHRPVLVVLGNPPYSNFGRQNRNDFILGLLDDYKRGLKEKKLNLDDDFIKFVRWAQWRIEQTGQGIVGFITNNVYLDGLTHRRMRESLLGTFDEIYVLNLHGSAKKQETTPEGTKDDNVFDITVGVAIALFVKLPPGRKAEAKKKLATVHHADLWGLRKNKYDWLNGHNAINTDWTTFGPDPPDFRFVPRNAKHEKEWNAGWSIRNAFVVSGNAIKTERDRVSIHFNRKEAEAAVHDFRTLSIDELRKKFELDKDSRDWSVDRAKKDTLDHPGNKLFAPILYRPFDVRHTWFSGRAKGFIGTPAAALMRHFLAGGNFGFITTRQTKEEFGVLATHLISGHKSCAAYDINTVFPLYLYPNGEAEEQAELVPHENGRRPNLSGEFVKFATETIGLEFVADGRGDLKKTFGPEDIFDYIYAALHSPKYRERYEEFLKLEFPRVQLTSDRILFKKLSQIGGKLIGLHTLQELGSDLISFDIPGENVVEQVVYVPPLSAVGDDVRSLHSKTGAEDSGEKSEPHVVSYKPGKMGRVYINAKQYFEGITPKVWEFRVGSYQVCEKWLKDRKGRTLGADDLEHYQHTVSALAETRTLMAQIDSLIADHGGWPIK